jgi:hypothetical protein
MKPKRSYPHCDARVLHAPGQCSIRDQYATDLQEIRQIWGINFTGESDPSKSQCPAEAARPLETINKWGGNTAKPNDAELFLDRLGQRGGVIVSSNDLSVVDIAVSRACGNFYVDKNSFGYAHIGKRGLE